MSSVESTETTSLVARCTLRSRVPETVMPGTSMSTPSAASPSWVASCASVAASWARVALDVSAAAIKGGDTGGTDEFIARQAWLYVAIVTGAYLISRGLAKSGSREPYTERLDEGHRDGEAH